mmetsp:Transcript_34172/g.65283  ORF Transcript_34172/g.65283 Transcript_34172/m.65283 type:complete len:180 (-) Transcript_34172:188-727(-)|eukprot:CAMPEP_0114250286 /NCGR_PEP_ID=MMETSP0058-20121206/14615_1 /TAXON_ID=36894 /ORGANISM="Pyramimonas parkeae, CCMP726" /LENGTH=179 /DNA_ID=CAMNT_0001363929 /DNA_START=205 /DNA_END=744 /DNA_ORIENTATION=-
MGAKKGKKKDALDPAEFEAKDNLKRSEAEIFSLQRQLDVAAQEMQYAREHEREWRERLDAFGVAMEQQRENTLDIMADMSRQFKAMQEKHLLKIGTLEKRTEELQQALDDKDDELARVRAEYEATIASKDSQIKDLKHKQEIMAQEFAEMLKETLDKMAECLENTDDKRYNIQELPTGE